MILHITRKDFLSIAGGLATAAAMPAVWRPDRAHAQGALTLRLAHPDTSLHPNQIVATKLAELVAAKTSGAVHNSKTFVNGRKTMCRKRFAMEFKEYGR